MENKLLTIKEVEEKLHVSTPTVRRLVKEKLLKCVRVGFSLRFDPKDVEEYIETNKS